MNLINQNKTQDGLDFSLPVWIVVLLLLTITYWPVLYIEYAHHNDYLIGNPDIVKDITRGVFSNGEVLHLFIYGRPLNAILHDLFFSGVNAVNDLALVRYLSFSITFLVAVVSFYFFKKRILLSDQAAILLTIAISTSPGILLFNFWASNIVPGVITYGLSLVGGILILTGVSDSKIRQEITGCILFIMALLTYPPNAMFVLIPVTSWWFFANIEKRSFGTLLRVLLSFLVCLLLFYLYLKNLNDVVLQLLMPKYLGYASNNGNYSISTVTLGDLYSRLHNYSSMVFPYIFNILPEKTLYAGMVIFCLCILMRGFELKKLPFNFAFDLLSILLLMFLFSFPVIVSSDWAPGVRNTGPVLAFGTVMFVYLFLTLSKYIKIAVIMPLTIIICLVSSSYIYKAILNDQLELLFVRTWIDQEFDPHTKKINIITMFPQHQTIVKDNFVPLPRMYSEFNLMANNYGFMMGILQWELAKKGFDLPRYDVFINEPKSVAAFMGIRTLTQTKTRSGDRFTNTHEGNVLDFNKIGNVSNGFKFGHSDIFVETTLRESKFMEPFSSAGVLNGSDPGWHVEIDDTEDVYLEFDFKPFGEIDTVILTPQSGHAERMPKHIVVEASTDGASFLKVFENENLCKQTSVFWPFGGGKVKFEIEKHKYKKLKVRFFSTCNSQKLMTIKKVELK